MRYGITVLAKHGLVFCIVRLVEELKSLSVSILCMLFYRLPHDDKISIQNDGSTITVSGDSADLRG